MLEVGFDFVYFIGMKFWYELNCIKVIYLNFLLFLSVLCCYFLIFVLVEIKKEYKKKFIDLLLLMLIFILYYNINMLLRYMMDVGFLCKLM